MVDLTKFEELLRRWSRDENFRILVINLDDVFRALILIGVKEITVDKEKMELIVSYFITNMGNTELGSLALKEGKIDKFMGIKLVLK